MQFKTGGHADLHNVHIVVYGHAHDRYDQIYGNEFTYDPQSGDINAIGEVHIDLQGNAEGPLKPDQAPPEELKNPLHLLTHSLTFNQKTGIAQTDEVVEFRSAQASGSAKGAYYDSKTNELQLKSDVHIVTTGDNPATITGTSGTIQKEPRQAVLLNARIDQPDKTLTADKGTLLFEPDNTVQHVDGRRQCPHREPRADHRGHRRAPRRSQHGAEERGAAGDPVRRREVRHPWRQRDPWLGGHVRG